MNVEQFLIEGHTPINYQTKYISTYPSIFKNFKDIYNFPKNKKIGFFKLKKCWFCEVFSNIQK